MVYEFALTFAYQYYRHHGKNKTWVFSSAVILAIIPLAAVKYLTAFPDNSIGFVIGFIGISYVTFKTVQIIMEMRDGAIKKVDPITYARFLLFFQLFLQVLLTVTVDLKKIMIRYLRVMHTVSVTVPKLIIVLVIPITRIMTVGQ